MRRVDGSIGFFWTLRQTIFKWPWHIVYSLTTPKTTTFVKQQEFVFVVVLDDKWMAHWQYEVQFKFYSVLLRSFGNFTLTKTCVRLRQSHHEQQKYEINSHFHRRCRKPLWRRKKSNDSIANRFNRDEWNDKKNNRRLWTKVATMRICLPHRGHWFQRTKTKARALASQSDLCETNDDSPTFQWAQSRRNPEKTRIVQNTVCAGCVVFNGLRTASCVCVCSHERCVWKRDEQMPSYDQRNVQNHRASFSDFFFHSVSRLIFIARNDAKGETAFELRTISKRFNLVFRCALTHRSSSGNSHVQIRI